MNYSYFIQMPDFISDLPIGTIIFAVVIVVGLIISIIKKMLKIAIFILSVLVILFVLYKLVIGYI
ncbi:MAG: hypothetical protein LBO69_07395 [Ignavibacteria bacterium]|nr:hypothetical protein [Ignavibacteria bacterium]